MAFRTLFLALIILSIPGYLIAQDVPYDHSFTYECLAKPLEPQYGGGIVVNPDAKQCEGLEGWTKVNNTEVEVGQKNNDSNNYIIAARFGIQESAKLKFQLEEDKLYAFSGWVQASKGNAYVQAVFITSTGNYNAGWVAAREGCWSMLKGGLVVNVSSPAELYLMRDNSSTAEIWASSISLQPFTDNEWKSQQYQSIEKVRKRHIKIIVKNQDGQRMPNATVFINQTRPNFPLGCAMNTLTISNENLRNWFISRFKTHTIFENEFRWHIVQTSETTNNYTDLDNLFNFTKAYGLSVRGHPIHTSIRNAQPGWINESIINDQERFQSFVDARTRSLVERYKGQVIHWDVVNEHLNDGFFEEKLGNNASTIQYQMVHEIDPDTPIYMNEYYAIANSSDELGSPWKYMQRIWKIREQGYNGPLGIGVAGRFLGTNLNLPYVRASLDVLGSLKLPIWITELIVSNTFGANQAAYLEQIMMELHAHYAVEGIMLWAAMRAFRTCWLNSCLTDYNGVNLATGDVVDKLMAEWNYASGLRGTTNVDGSFDMSLFYGEYEAYVTHPTLQTPKSFNLVPNVDANGVQHTTLVLELQVDGPPSSNHKDL